jgi:hypothetical protein
MSTLLPKGRRGVVFGVLVGSGEVIVKSFFTSLISASGSFHMLASAAIPQYNVFAVPFVTIMPALVADISYTGAPDILFLVGFERRVWFLCHTIRTRSASASHHPSPQAV